MKVKSLQASNVTASSSARTAASKHSSRCFWGMVSEPVPRVHTEGLGLCHSAWLTNPPFVRSYR